MAGCLPENYDCSISTIVIEQSKLHVRECDFLDATNSVEDDSANELANARSLLVCQKTVKSNEKFAENIQCPICVIEIEQPDKQTVSDLKGLRPQFH